MESVRENIITQEYKIGEIKNPKIKSLKKIITQYLTGNYYRSLKESEGNHEDFNKNIGRLKNDLSRLPKDLAYPIVWPLIKGSYNNWVPFYESYTLENKYDSMTHNILSLAFSPDGQHLVFVDDSAKVSCLNLGHIPAPDFVNNVRVVEEELPQGSRESIKGLVADVHWSDKVGFLALIGFDNGDVDFFDNGRIYRPSIWYNHEVLAVKYVKILPYEKIDTIAVAVFQKEYLISYLQKEEYVESFDVGEAELIAIAASSQDRIALVLNKYRDSDQISSSIEIMSPFDEIQKTVDVGKKVTALKFSEDGKNLAIGSLNKILLVDSCKKESVPSKYQWNKQYSIDLFEFNKKNTVLAGASKDSSDITLWDIKEFNSKNNFTHIATISASISPRALAFSNTELLAAARGNAIKVFGTTKDLFEKNSPTKHIDCLRKISIKEKVNN
jgi:WD40 repeat protein